MSQDLLIFNQNGIYCPPADVYIDPWRRVSRAIVTHAHADHSRWGMGYYLAHHDSLPVMRHRLGKDISVEGKAYGETFLINGVKFSLHPAGHIIGSAQVRVEYKGQVWVASGDYKTGPDPSCTPFEPVKCHAFITESTFGLPVYTWQSGEDIMAEVNSWWQAQQAAGKVAVLFGYSLGKAQRLLMGLNPEIGPIFTHAAVENLNEVLRPQGMQLPATTRVVGTMKKDDFQGGIVVSPPSGEGAWMKRLGPHVTAMASGWMAVRGQRRRRNVDKGFILSDHADWRGLNAAIAETGAETVIVTHGYTNLFARYLAEQGLDARVVETQYENEEEEPTSTTEPEGGEG
ncbi:MAG: ligase-associated DNA damage response exonuclease [Bacteroidota bacterium]